MFVVWMDFNRPWKKTDTKKELQSISLVPEKKLSLNTISCTLSLVQKKFRNWSQKEAKMYWT